MSVASALTPLPVLIPIGGAALTMFLGRRPRLQRAITLAALMRLVAVCAALIYLTDRHGTIASTSVAGARRCRGWGRWASRSWWIGCRR